MNVTEHQLFGFHAGGQAAYLPLMHVREIVRGLPFTPLARRRGGVCGMVNLRGHILTAISPCQIWADAGVPADDAPWGQDSLNMIVVHAGTLYSFLIDRCGDVEMVLDKDIEPLTAQSGIWPVIASGICIKDGVASPVLEIPALLAYVEQDLTHGGLHHEKMSDC